MFIAAESHPFSALLSAYLPFFQIPKPTPSTSIFRRAIYSGEPTSIWLLGKSVDGRLSGALAAEYTPSAEGPPFRYPLVEVFHIRLAFGCRPLGLGLLSVEVLNALALVSLPLAEVPLFQTRPPLSIPWHSTSPLSGAPRCHKIGGSPNNTPVGKSIRRLASASTLLAELPSFRTRFPAAQMITSRLFFHPERPSRLYVFRSILSLT